MKLPWGRWDSPQGVSSSHAVRLARARSSRAAEVWIAVEDINRISAMMEAEMVAFRTREAASPPVAH
jgi:hypothetical protein